MPLYRVHTYAVTRVQSDPIVADTPEEAVAISERDTDLYQAVKNCEFADDVTGFLVDTLDPNTLEVIGEGKDIRCDKNGEQ